MMQSTSDKSKLASKQPLLDQVQSALSAPNSTVIKEKSATEVQGSIVTIFTIWNSMMGVSILSIPWGIHKAGLFFGLSLLIFMGMLSLYTAYLIASSPKQLAKTEKTLYELSDVCRVLFGRVGEIVALFFSILVLFGVVLASWVLLSNSLYFTGKLIHDLIISSESTNNNESSTICETYCQAEDVLTVNLSANHTSEKNPFGFTFANVWQLRLTVPILLAILMLPLLSFKSPTFFTKFTTLGTISVLYLLTFNFVQSIKCGFNCDFHNSKSPHYVEGFSSSFPALTGMLSMSFFIHNTLLGIFRCQQNPQNNTRDLCIAYGLVLLTYTFVAIAFYTTFPLSRDCIQDNLLNNFHADYRLSSIARVLIFFQCFTIFPLIVYFIRSQISCMLYNDPWPGIVFVLILNVALVASGVGVAIFYPNVGSIVRYFGAASGVIIVYTLPCLIYMKISHTANELTIPKIIFHSCIIVFGFANVIGQVLV